MEIFTNLFNILLSLGTLLTLCLGGWIIYLYVYKKETYTHYQTKYALGVMTLVSGIATISSLVYSLVIGFPPCDLCWYQRIFIYGVFFIAITAWMRRHSFGAVTPYIKTFLSIGGIIALYHTIVYYVGINPIPCSTDVSCTARYVYEFGFMTIPLMSLVTFIFLGTLVLPQPKK